MRKSPRYEEIGRADVPKLCALPGVLDNISAEGCKIHFPFAVTVDLENDYDIKITPANSPAKIFQLLCHPQWVKEAKNTTEIGFSVLPSKNYRELLDYVSDIQKALQKEQASDARVVCSRP